MDLTEALPHGELVSARLTVLKIAKVMGGLMSVGTASLQLDDRGGFLAGRDKTLLGAIEALRCLGVKAEHAEAIEPLRSRVRELSELASRFHALFMDLTPWRDLPAGEVESTADRLADCYARFCDRLTDLGSRLGIEVEFSITASLGRMFMEDFVRFTETAPLPAPP